MSKRNQQKTIVEITKKYSKKPGVKTISDVYITDIFTRLREFEKEETFLRLLFSSI